MSLCDRLEQFFKQHPEQWIDGRTLATIAGNYGWRTRASDLRRRGLAIANRQRRIKREDGSVFVISEYRYQPVEVTA
jgi:hypothetical protein